MTQDTDLETQARRHAADLGQQAKDAITGVVSKTAGAAQDHAARELQATANAVHAAAGQFLPDSIQAQAAQMVAGRLEEIAYSVRSLDFQDTINEVSAFARRNPVMFLGAAALAGFAATRFFKATPTEDGPDQSEGGVLKQMNSETPYATS